MRKIAFRAWHKKDKKMYEVIRMELDDNHGNMWVEVIRDEEYSCGMDTVELMQFTGLKDKNGREIYEGDIVRDIDFGQKERAVGQVYFQGYSWIIGKSPKHKTWWNFSDIVGEEGQFIEVIGNIYENPELLK